MDALIYGVKFWTMSGEEDVLRASAFCIHAVATAALLIVGLAWVDALPPRVCPTRVRLAAFAFVTVYKSEVRAPFGTFSFSTNTFLHTVWKTTLARMFLFIFHTIQTASIYSSYRIPELKIEGFVEFSSHKTLCKSCMHVCRAICTQDCLMLVSRLQS